MLNRLQAMLFKYQASVLALSIKVGKDPPADEPSAILMGGNLAD